ncbi:heme ABC exporter ATP-binding protein CcmA [Vineibacter terrae]|uniref:Heme ABC exporter ATP-binding protein CcmA n=1 Tax=Vineibacter terrae TaxID=2586908 RepID=A0A5C8PND8_9HYPH|nr:heme ABC exporter ATP-binding protein CcmA [Vineibacter terrae]TXL75997.1 heme ABC exporter ATP-binding protein CcmA [Vineibacter terrae]
MSLLSAQSLACRRGGRLVFHDLGFEVAAGRALLLTGRNGAGKSTLLRVLALLTPAQRGEIAWDGKPVREDAEAWRARLAWLGHADAVKGDLTVRETLEAAQWLCAGGPPSRALWDGVLARFDLVPLLDRPGRYLSAGQHRRVALARVALSAATVWLLDEPAAALDEASRQSLHAAITDHLAAGGIAVIATHGDIVLPGALALDVGAFTPDGTVSLEAWA